MEVKVHQLFVLEWDANGIVVVGYGAKGFPQITEKQLLRILSI